MYKNRAKLCNPPVPDSSFDSSGFIFENNLALRKGYFLSFHHFVILGRYGKSCTFIETPLASFPKEIEDLELLLGMSQTSVF